MKRARPNKYRPGFNPVTRRCDGCRRTIGRVYQKPRVITCRHCKQENPC